MFSYDYIPACTGVVVCGGVVLCGGRVTEEMRAMQIGPDTYLVEDIEKPQLDDFINHGCEPNLGFLTGSLTLYSLRDIAPGEELLFDYSTCMNEPGWMIRCRCGAKSCRRTDTAASAR